MNETAAEASRIVQITLCTAQEAVAARIKECSHPDFVRTRVTRLHSISDFAKSAATSPDVLIVDVSDDCDVESLFAANARKLLSTSEIVVLCDAQDSSKWQEYVLRQEIADCFIICPMHDPGYLKVQIWRAIRSCLNKGEAHEANVDTTPVDASTVSESQFAGLRALVLEDDAPSVEAITDMLIGFGFAVKHASSVVEAIRKFGDRRFDVFLVDLMMPGVSGADVIRAVRDNLKDAEAPIIVTSAFSDDDLVRNCIDEGASEYIIKPITRARLLPRLRAVLANY